LYYDAAPGAVRRVGAPVISVGNLTVGGTGKTPTVAELVRLLTRMGRRPAVLTRGYGGTARQQADEVLEFGAMGGVPVIINPDRVAGAAAAAASYHADVLVLDDGFQHRRIHRHLDMVLIDALAPWGGGRLLPAGRLREPVSELGRADAVVISRANQVESTEVDAIRERVRALAPRAEVLTTSVTPWPYLAAEESGPAPIDFGGRRILPVCGIGNPRTFLKLIESTKNPAPPCIFPDHHRYTRADVERICNRARAAGVEAVVTTGKDYVKLEPMWRLPATVARPPLICVQIRMRFDDPAAIEGLLRRALSATSSEPATDSE
jgi:tetraacyldisaccharide 4'-kinase